MARLVIGWGLNALALYGLTYVLPGFRLSGFAAAVVLAAVLAVVNTLVRPVLLLLTLPVNLATLGCFTFVINGALFALAAYLVRGVQVNGIGNAIIGAILFGILSSILNGVFNPKGD